MNCKVEKTENANEVKLEITVEAEKFDNAIKKIYFQNAKYFSVPGFRKGRVPQNIVERYYGKEIFYEDAFNDIATEEYQEAIKENKLDVVSKPIIDVIKMEKGQDLVFTAIVQTKPDVTLGKYKGIEIEKIEYNVSAEDIDKELKEMQEKNSRLISVETPVENGNTVVIDFEGFVDGVPFEGGKAENHSLEIGSGSFIPGFEDQIIGMNIDEEKEIEVTFPEEYFTKDLAGKDATFKVKVHEIKKKEVPELDDEFAKDVSEFDTIEELKQSIKERLEKQNIDKEKYEKQEAVMNVVTSEMEVDIPDGMIEVEVDNMIRDLEQRVSYQGLTLERYLQLINKTEEELRHEYEESAINSIKYKLALESISESEKIEAGEEEIKNKIGELAKIYNRKPEDLENNEVLKENIIQGIKNEKALNLLVENATMKA